MHVMDFHTNLPVSERCLGAPQGMKYALIIGNVERGTVHGIATADREADTVAEAIHSVRVQESTES